MASTGMNARRTGAILMIGLLLVSAVAPAVMAQTDESLAVDVTQDETGETVITAADNGTAVENATVTVTATDGTGTATTAVEPVPPEPVEPFGQVVSAFVDVVKGAGFTGIGSQVSDFVTSNNPSNAGNSGAVTSPEAGNDAPVTPPGQGTKNDSGAVPVGPPVEDPGNSGSAPGQSGDDDEDDERNEETKREDGDSSNGNAGGNGR